MLNDEEKQYLEKAIDAAIKASPSAIAASQVLVPILKKIVDPEPPKPQQSE